MSNFVSGQVVSAEHMNSAIGGTTATSVSNLPITHRLVVASISSSSSLSLNGVPQIGNEIHVLIKNVGSSKITITIPNSGVYVNCGKDTIDIESGKVGEVNAVSDGTKVYLRSI